MKKRIAIIVACTVIFIASLTCAQADYREIVSGPAIAFDGEVTECTSVVLDDTHYVPLRKVFEKLGAAVYYRYRDRQILAITRGGDMISHIVGDNKITVNGAQRTFANSSFSQNNETYIPIEMVSGVIRGDVIDIPMPKTAHNKNAEDIFNARNASNFYPERFKRYINYHAKAPSSGISDVIFIVNLGLDYPAFENVTVVSNPYDRRVLVNKHNKLPAGFAQKNLVNMNKAYTVSDGKQYLLHDTAYRKFVQMAKGRAFAQGNFGVQNGELPEQIV